MPYSAHRSLLQALAALAMGATPGYAAPERELSKLPVDLVDELLGDEAFAALRRDDRLRVLRLLAADPRPGVRRAVPEAVAALARDGGERRLALGLELLAQLGADHAPLVREATARALAELLPLSAPDQCAHLLAEWAHAPAVGQREVLALALADVGSPVPLGVPTTLAVLAHDSSAEVRAAVARAAARLGDKALLAQLAQDDSALVRKLARRGSAVS